MSQISTPFVTDKIFAEAMDRRNNLLEIIAKTARPEILSYKQIQSIVQQGRAPDIFKIGDQINVNWNDGNGNNYLIPLDIVAFQNVETLTGTVPGMYVQWHYTLPFGVSFDAAEAIYVAESALPPGNYYFTQIEAYGIAALKTAGQVWSFTTTQTIPAGGHICITPGANGLDESNVYIDIYESGQSFSVIERIKPLHESAGTNLGDWSLLTKSESLEINNMQRSVAGYNRWKFSNVRQWLNSNKPAFEWWTSQNKFDRSNQIQYWGFLLGFDSEFSNIIKPIKVRTYLNNKSDSEITPRYEDTFDMWFLASLEQEFITPESSGEGTYWPYWKQRVGHSNPSTRSITEVERIRYKINDKSKPAESRTRSASLNQSALNWITTEKGYINHYGVSSPYFFAPAAVIC